MTNALEHRYDIYIRAPRDKVWQGLTDGEMTLHYVYGTRLRSRLAPGAPYAYVGDGDFAVVDGEVLEVEPGVRLVMTWRAHWDEAVGHDAPSRVTYELSAAGEGATRLRVVHDGFEGPTATYQGSGDGWARMMSSLKSLLETGRALDVA